MFRTMMTALSVAMFLTWGAVEARSATADFDSDHDVDLADAAGFQGCFGIPEDDDCVAAFDFDRDGNVDLDDYATFRLRLAGPDMPPGMVLIPGGEFDMGDHHDGMSWCLPVHAVYVDSFYMDIYEVTNRQYADALNWAYGQGSIQVSGGVVEDSTTGNHYCDTTTSSSYSRITWDGATFGVTAGKEDHPMVQVNWYGTAAYTNWRSAQDGLTPSYNLSTWECDFDAGGYRLATEAEWEYAARGGLHTPYRRYPWGNLIDGSMANYRPSGDPYETGPYPWTTPVGYYDGNQIPAGVDMANGYGLYDMAGNVWEWCHDWYDEPYSACDPPPCDNPHGPPSGSYRVLRGGSWNYVEDILRCAYRGRYDPDDRYDGGGFRVVLDSE